MTAPLIRHPADMPEERWDDGRGTLSFRTLFGGDGLTSSLVTGIAELPPGGFLAPHRHTPAETYYLLAGRGVVMIDGKEAEVGAGSCVLIPGDAEHGIRAAGGEPLRFFYAIAAGSFDEVEYRFTAPVEQT